MTAPFQLTGCRLSGSRLLSGPPNTYDQLYALAGQVPAFDLRFFNGSIVDAIGGITPTFTRPSSVQTVWTGAGFTDFAADVPAFAVDPATGRTGYVHNLAATNLFLNSASPATQSFTVTAQAYTLSFYGTGTITLSGASTAGPLVGTGAAPNRVSLTFTPSAGTLTLTLSGSIVRPQLETGLVATSPITTGGSAVIRAADAMTVSGAPFSSFYNQLGGVLYADITASAPSGAIWRAARFAGTGSAAVRVGFQNNSVAALEVVDVGGASQVAIYPSVTASNRRIAVAFQENNFGISINGAIPSTDIVGTLPTLSSLSVADGSLLFHRFIYWPIGPAQSRLQLLSS